MKGDVVFMIRKIYAYVISFVTLMMIIGGSVGVIASFANKISPDFYYDTYSQYVSNYHTEYDDKGNSKVTLTKPELKESYDEYVQAEKERTENSAIKGIIVSIGWIFISLPIFIWMQVKIRKEKE